jgi:hypothetical protein
MVIENLGINRQNYPSPSSRQIDCFMAKFAGKTVDLGKKGPDGIARPGASVVVGAFRPKTMTWKPAWKMHERFKTHPCYQILSERDYKSSVYWRVRVTKR